MLELQYELESKAAKWYATIDIANAFFSIPLAAECRAQFAFTWKGVQYTWNRLPQGWKHSPTICHGLIQTTLEKGTNRKWKAAVWSPTRRVAQATEGQGGSSQVAELKAIQLALDIAEREK
ncbi:hypothetical protein DUI87_13439 [Hirundo rustica rustica]|uniref:ribonuclease H n=1 Tax=Hirundo rustica rustica TaxID=333673 RepID=A0A3M0K8X6_HIRRU|nr:hypothetical protein DUI87_13439 [Hirundo rustica rustica]